MTVEHHGDLFVGQYPGDSEIRAQLTPAQLDSLYRVLAARVLAPALSDISLVDFCAAGVDDLGRMSRDAPRRRSILYSS